MRRSKTGMFIALTLVLAGTACIGGGGGDSGGGGSEAGGKTVISFFTGTAETAALEAKAKHEIEIFEQENPDIQVEREALPPDDVRTVIQTRLRSNNPPDVFTFDTGPGFGGVLADAGLLYPLDKAYEENGWKIYDWARQRATYNGKTYGVPSQVEELGVYYNKDFFDEQGFSEPKTLDEFRKIAEAARNNDMIPLAFGDNEKWPAGHLFSMAVSNLLGRKGLDDILYADGRWNSPTVVKGIDLFFRDFVSDGYYPEDVNAITYDDANTLFYGGKAAMLPTGTWLVAELEETVRDFEIGFFPFPSIDGSSVSPAAGVGSGFFVAADTDEPEAAIKLLDFFQSQKTGQRTAEEFNTIPAYPLDTSALDVPPLFKEVLTDLSSAPESSFGYNIDVLTPVEFNEVMFDGFQDVLNADRTAQEQADALQQAWAKAEKAGETLEKP